MKARYNRISTASQNIERQLAKQNPDEILYNDVVSGAIAFAEREQGKKLIEGVKAGKIDYVVVSSIDRAGRNLHDIINTIALFDEYNVVFKVENLGIVSRIDGKKNPTFDLIVSVMANVASMERSALLERQKEGIAIAKAKGTYKGRVKGSIESADEVLAKYKDVVKFIKMGKSLRDITGRCTVSLGTVQKVKRIMQDA